MIDLRFKETQEDQTSFIKTLKNKSYSFFPVFDNIIIYVDNIIITGNYENEQLKWKQCLAK